MAKCEYKVESEYFDSVLEAREYAASLARQKLQALGTAVHTSRDETQCSVNVIRVEDGTIASTCRP